MKKIESFHYCFNAITSQRSSGSIASNYSRLAIRLTKAHGNDEIQIVLKDLTAFLVSKLPEKDEFVVKFSDLEYSSQKTKLKAIVKYTLSQLLPSDNAALPIDYNRLTIEHILSESALKSDDGLDVQSIGNLILLDQKTNSEELADKKPLDKFQILNQKQYPFTGTFIDIDSPDWGNNEISKRTQEMASYIYDKMVKKIK